MTQANDNDKAWVEKLAPWFEPQYMSERLMAFYCITQLKIDPYEVVRMFPADVHLPNLALPLELTHLKVLPTATGATSAVYCQFLEALRVARHPISFRVYSDADTVFFQLGVASADLDLVERQIELHFPEFATSETDPLPPIEQFQQPAPWRGSKLFQTLGAFHLDPYQQLFAAFEATHGTGVTSCFEVVFVPADELLGTIVRILSEQFDPDRSGALREFGYNYKIKVMEQHVRYTWFLNHLHLHCYVNNTPSDEILRRTIKELTAKRPAWWASVRLYSTDNALLERLSAEFVGQYNTVEQEWGNNPGGGYDEPHPCGGGACLSTEELAALVHFPGKGATCESLEIVSMKSKRPPELLLTSDGIKLGTNEWRKTASEVRLPESFRDRHLYIVGKTRTGKSTLLFNLALQDIQAGKGVAVVDPHGDLVEELLHHVPEERFADVIYFDAADRDHPIALNVLDAQNETEVGLLADDLVVTFRRLSESWGERMENILRYTFHTLLLAPGTTLLDVGKILKDESFRKQVLSRVTFRPVLDFWCDQFPTLPKDAFQPILSRMGKFVLSPVLSGILSQKESRLNFFDVLQSKKVLLVNLSQGKVGDDTAKLLGSLVVSQIQLATMRRASLPKEQRDPYYLYVDEFQNFTTSAFDKILSEAGKYKLCLTLAHQYIAQLDDKTRSAILGNVGTIIAFTIWPNEAHHLRYEIGAYTVEDLANLERFHAICRPPTKSADAFLLKTLPAPGQPAPSMRNQIIEHTQRVYSTPPEHQVPMPAVAVAEEPATKETRRPLPRPAAAVPRSPTLARDRILSYLGQAGYLATSQLHELCYSHLPEPSRGPSASRDLRTLLDEQKVKMQPFGRSNVYYTSRTCNPTSHNLAVRDLYVGLVQSGFELAEVSFTLDLGNIRPDLYAAFLAEDGSLIKTLWEYDTGTEGLAEIVRKVARYESFPDYHRVVLVAREPERVEQLQKAVSAPFLVTVPMQGDFSFLLKTVFSQDITY